MKKDVKMLSKIEKEMGSRFVKRLGNTTIGANSDKYLIDQYAYFKWLNNHNKRKHKKEISKAKKVLDKYIRLGVRSGFYDSRNIVGDTTETIFSGDTITIDVCLNWGYFECFADDETFKILNEYYEERVK